MKIISDIGDFVFPSLANWKKNRIIRDKIKKKEFSFPEKERIPKLSIENLKELYSDDFHRKEKLEDKAKTNVVGVSVSVTLIMGAYAMIKNISSTHGNGFLFWIGFSFFVIAVIYMFFAGIHSVHVLIAENTVHKCSLELKGDKEKNDLIEQVGMNSLRNLIRNNYVFTSYECIRNALACLFVVMIIAIIPSRDFFQTEPTKNVDCFNESSFCYSKSAINAINNGVDMKKVEMFIMQEFEEGTHSLIDEAENLFIKYDVSGNKATVYLIETISKKER